MKACFPQRRAARLIAGGVLWVMSCLSAAQSATQTTDPYPQTARSYLLVRDGKPLWERQADLPLPPASLTKLLSALLLVESDWQAQRWLTVSPTAANIAPTRLGLKAGEQIRAADALAAMLIHSANDACRVLVEDAAARSGGIDSFVARMNALAAVLGMSHSHFADPCGFDAAGQHSTTRDLYQLALAAQAQPLIAQLAAQAQGELRTRTDRVLRFASTNQLLGRLAGTRGLKTGYTAQAGQCLIADVQRDGHEVWLVMLGGSRRWWLAHGMINDAFDAP